MTWEKQLDELVPNPDRVPSYVELDIVKSFIKYLLKQRDEELVARLEGMRVRNKLYDEALARENIERFGYEHINTQEYGLNKAIDKAIALVREGKI